MSKFAAALAALLVVSPAIRAAELTLLEAAENNEHASAMRLAETSTRSSGLISRLARRCTASTAVIL